MPVTRHFIEGALEPDSNVYNVTCSLDDLPSKEVIDRIIVDYVLYLIGKHGSYGLQLFPGKEGRTEWHRTTQYIMRCLVERAAEFEKAFLPRFENRQALLLKRPENAEVDFKQTLEAIWSDGLTNWGRFLAYISFVGAYCLSALNAGMIYEIKFLVEAAVDKLEQCIGSWIKRSGGWRVCYLKLKDVNLLEL
ncbi:unnamed protein product [Hydatigera taeniaeformis]|uniref:BCL domain-containing protein n=1 Tax=Hydatigena taeniaeformis TaxID=6205 RepID=A0A0R3WW04_HYDTA|nr:unnamed protein product [Hydatigera taeniaeformis]